MHYAKYIGLTKTLRIRENDKAYGTVTDAGFNNCDLLFNDVNCDTYEVKLATYNFLINGDNPIKTLRIELEGLPQLVTYDTRTRGGFKHSGVRRRRTNRKHYFM